MAKTKYQSDIVLGETYKHKHSNFQGRAIAIAFFENACERVDLEYYTDEPSGITGKHRHLEAFDAVDLIHVETGKKAKSEKTGGPERRSEGLMPR